MLKEKAARIKLLILDVDGVMTDGQIILNAHGEDIKCFNVKDGQGLRLLMKAGVDVAIVTGRKSKSVEHRAAELGISELHQGIDDKESVFADMLERKRLKSNQVCCIGDDLPDIPLINRVGLSIAVADAVPEVRDAASHVTERGGGKGAVREVCELILKSQDSWPPHILIPLKK
jgi:3-deoxy-D-manno-octulosonate 8-phosphate phosphatase (KDO 8-P phosphatase)